MTLKPALMKTLYHSSDIGDSKKWTMWEGRSMTLFIMDGIFETFSLLIGNFVFPVPFSFQYIGFAVCNGIQLQLSPIVPVLETRLLSYIFVQYCRRAWYQIFMMSLFSLCKAGYIVQSWIDHFLTSYLKAFPYLVPGVIQKNISNRYIVFSFCLQSYHYFLHHISFNSISRTARFCRRNTIPLHDGTNASLLPAGIGTWPVYVWKEKLRALSFPLSVLNCASENAAQSQKRFEVFIPGEEGLGAQRSAKLLHSQSIPWRSMMD